jgi:hypothetical protein
MIANAAFLAAVVTFLLAAWLAGELSYLARYKSGLFRAHGPQIVAVTVIVFLNFVALFYTLGRWLFLRDAGRKLTHIDRQLATRDGMLEDLREHMKT